MHAQSISFPTYLMPFKMNKSLISGAISSVFVISVYYVYRFLINGIWLIALYKSFGHFPIKQLHLIISVIVDFFKSITFVISKRCDGTFVR